MTNERGELEGLGESIAEMCAHLDAAMHRMLVALREFDERNGWAVQGALSCAHWLAWRVGWDQRTARERVRVARSLGELPVVAEALKTGALSCSKVREISRVATPATEATLVEYARHMPAGPLAKVCQGYASVQRRKTARPDDAVRTRTVIRHTLEDGMVRIEAVLTTDEAALVWAALDEVRRDRDAADSRGPAGPAHAAGKAQLGPCRADNLVALAQAHLRGDRPNRTPVEIVVTVPRDRLTVDATAAEVENLARLPDGTPVSTATARRLACDAGLVEVVVDDNGQPLSVGRRTRTIPGAIKRALLVRDRTCRFPGCTNDRFVDGHHIQHWANGGETSLRNLVTLCSAHHRLLHEGAVSVVLDVHQQPTFRDARGTIIDVEHPRAALHDPWPALGQANAALGITARTNRCRWDGQPIDRHQSVADLARLDGLGDEPVASTPIDPDEPVFEPFVPLSMAEIMEIAATEALGRLDEEHDAFPAFSAIDVRAQLRAELCDN